MTALPDIEVTATLLARAKNWSERTARRRMLEIHRAHPAVVERRGRVLVSSAKRLEPFIPGIRVLLPIEREVGRLRERVSEVELRLDAEIRARKAFQEQAHRWFSTGHGVRKKPA